MTWTASGEHWSEEITVTHDDGTDDELLHYLKLAYVVQLHRGGPWFASCLGQRFGGFPDKEAAMRRCGAYLAENWHKIEWMKAQ